MTILQWNARTLIANRQEFKVYIDELEEKTEIICIQEAQLNPNLDFVIKGFKNGQKRGKWGRVYDFRKQGIQYQILGEGIELEYSVVEIWGTEGIRNIIFYNLCKLLTFEKMEESFGRESYMVWGF